MDSCHMLINFDTFGGNEAPYIASAQGVSGVATEGETLYAPVISGRSLEDPEGKWRMYDPSLMEIIMVTNYPEWLQQNVTVAASPWLLSCSEWQSEFCAARIPLQGPTIFLEAVISEYAC